MRPASDLQKEYLEFIYRFVCEHGYQPNRGELAENFGVYPRAVADTVGQLAKRGLVVLPEATQERCLGLPHVRFRAVVTDRKAAAAAAAASVADIVKVLVGHVERSGYQPTITQIAAEVRAEPKTVIRRITAGEAAGVFTPAASGRRRERAVAIANVRFEIVYDHSKTLAAMRSSGV